MHYDVISADCHIDLIWLPPDLFTSQRRAALKDRMPYVTEGRRGREWVTKNGASFGLDAGMGSAGRKYEPGKIHRSDRMATTGLYDPEQQRIRRLTDPDLRLKDQDRDGIQAEVLYGVLGATSGSTTTKPPAKCCASTTSGSPRFLLEAPRALCRARQHPEPRCRSAVAEIERVARRGNVRGLEIARQYDMTPLWDPWWNPVWDAAAASGLPVHFHTIGGSRRDYSKLSGKTLLAARAAGITSFQMHMADVLMSMIFAGVLEHRPQFEDGHRRGRHRLDPLYSRPHGRGMGGPVQGARPEDEAERVLAPPVLCDLPERPDRGETARGARRRQHHVGLGLPAPRRHLSGFAGIHRERAGPSDGGDPQEDRLRQRRETVPVRELATAQAAVMAETPLTGIAACVFDAYGTLFDFASAAAACERCARRQGRAR